MRRRICACGTPPFARRNLCPNPCDQTADRPTDAPSDRGIARDRRIGKLDSLSLFVGLFCGNLFVSPHPGMISTCAVTGSTGESDKK
jgi:hypothetical protein